MRLLDQYEINIYAVLVVLFLIFSVGYTVLIVRQQQTISQLVSAKEPPKGDRSNHSDVVTIKAHISPSCTGQIFSLEYRQANTQDIRPLEASLKSNGGQITAVVDRSRGNFNADTEYIIRSQTYLSKRKSLDDNAVVNFNDLVAGDLNNDSKINQKDLDLLNQKIKTGKLDDVKYDLNCDQSLDESDRLLLNSSVGKVSDT